MPARRAVAPPVVRRGARPRAQRGARRVAQREARVGPRAVGRPAAPMAGRLGGGPGSDGTIWLDAGIILWDGGAIDQTQVFPLTADGGRLVAWIAASSVGADLYYATDQNGFVPAALTDGGQVSPGSLSGVQFGDGVLLTYSTSSNTSDTNCEFISSTSGPAGIVAPNFFPLVRLRPSQRRKPAPSPERSPESPGRSFYSGRSTARASWGPSRPTACLSDRRSPSDRRRPTRSSSTH